MHLTDDIAEYVIHLLSDGLSQREVARRLGMSPASVNKIACGKYQWRQSGNDPQIEPADALPGEQEFANARRCSGCGGMVYRWPCLACSMDQTPSRPGAHMRRSTAETSPEPECLA